MSEKTEKLQALNTTTEQEVRDRAQAMMEAYLRIAGGRAESALLNACTTCVREGMFVRRLLAERYEARDIAKEAK